MKKLSLILVFTLLAVSVGSAQEVGYQLDCSTFDAQEAAEVPQPFSIVVQNRFWTLPGVEEWNRNFVEAEEVFLYGNMPRKSSHEVVDWVKELLPRTRQWLHEEINKSTIAEDEVVFVGGIALQR